MKITKSEQIRAGFHKSFQSGTSATVLTVCYGYKVTHGGELVIDPIEAKHCIFIFYRFINGGSLGKTSDTLARMDIVSPTGRATWSRETISKLPHGSLEIRWMPVSFAAGTWISTLRQKISILFMKPPNFY